MGTLSERHGVWKMSRLLLAVVAATALVRSAAAGDSFVYFGEGQSKSVDSAVYWEGQAGELAKQRAEAERNKALGRNTGPAVGYGAISTITGNPRKTYVSGYTRKNGTRVGPYYRSRK